MSTAARDKRKVGSTKWEKASGGGKKQTARRAKPKRDKINYSTWKCNYENI